ncbi:MAG: hypothetical protein COW71_04725 [Ignavibacteriales bacterium CG18_big_fil_WC_8_21_14_2_50_31_20]|nr:MAG: hypothetical protein COW71_04725 [Ignavibacteriales bacterium CG18_big_fil_WC_8_21_14_2_50_31_20]
MLNKSNLLVFITLTFSSLFAQNNSNLLRQIDFDNNKKIEKMDIPGEVYKITDKRTGKSYYKNLGNYIPKSKLQKTNNTIDTTIIYPDFVDTTQFNNMYEYYATVPVGTTAPIPIIAGDINKNGRAELYGERYNSYQKINERGIYEYNPNLELFEHKADLPWDSISSYVDFTQIYDINEDGSEDIFITGSLQVYDSIPPINVARTFKLDDKTNLPTKIDFDYKQCNQMNDPLWGEYDKREGTDLFYCGESCDLRVAAARYNKSTNSAETVFVYLVPEDIFYLAGTSNGDIDNDGFADLVTGGFRGDVVVFEYQEDIQNYKDVWYGDGGTFNVYIHFNSNDINRNGKKELWVGGDATYDGVTKTRLTCFEATGNNQYEAVHVIDIVGRMSFDAYNGFTVDINKDETEEIGLCLDQTFMIFKFNGNIEKWGFDLFYLKLNNFEVTQGRYFGAMMYDITNDGYEEILIMTDELFNNYKDKHIFTHIYMPTDLVSVKNVKFETNYYKLAQNYPNPFNPETIINYELGVSEFVTIKIYNVLGQEVAELVKKEQKAGNYSLIFNGADLPSGVYLVHMRAGEYSKTIKAVLNK